MASSSCRYEDDARFRPGSHPAQRPHENVRSLHVECKCISRAFCVMVTIISFLNHSLSIYRVAYRIQRNFSSRVGRMPSRSQPWEAAQTGPGLYFTDQETDSRRARLTQVSGLGWVCGCNCGFLCDPSTELCGRGRFRPSRYRAPATKFATVTPWPSGLGYLGEHRPQL